MKFAKAVGVDQVDEWGKTQRIDSKETREREGNQLGEIQERKEEELGEREKECEMGEIQRE